MTPGEARLILVGFVIIAAVAAWLIYHVVWNPYKRRQAERFEDVPCSVCGELECVELGHLAATQNQLNRIREKRRRVETAVLYPATMEARAIFGPGIAFPVNGDPRQVLFRWADPFDWFDGDVPEFNFPAPPSIPSPSDHADSRPWAHV